MVTFLLCHLEDPSFPSKTWFIPFCFFPEREATEELEALTTLCRQLEQWREETESELTVSQRMSDKMRAEKRTLADEKRELVSLFLQDAINKSQ